MPTLGKDLVLCHCVGITPPQYLTIDFARSRDRESWWVQLTKDVEKATKWQVESHDNLGQLVKISCPAAPNSLQAAANKKLFLCAHGKSRHGQAHLIGEEVFSVLVHTINDDNAVWHVTDLSEEVMPGGYSILRKAAFTNPGLAMAGLCYPDTLHQDSPDTPVVWKPVPIYNVVVRETKTTPALDLHVVWKFQEANTKADVDMDK